MTDPISDPSRRRFVGTLAAGLGAIVAGPALAQGSGGPPATPTGRPQPELEVPPGAPEGERLGWAVAGLGDFAQGYVLPALGRARFSRTSALVSGNRDKAEAVAARHGIRREAIHDYEGMGALRDDPDVAVVYVVTPNSTHAELTVRALEAGKHVLCEKPMANSPAECQRMIDAARAADRKLMIAYRAHFEPKNLAAKRMIDAGELGDVWFGASDHHRPLVSGLPRDEWRMRRAVAGGGSLVDIGIYSLNGLVWFFGEAPSAVLASVFSPPDDPRFAEVECTVTAQLRFPSGRRANISSGYDADKKRIDLFGSRAVAVLDPGTAYTGNRLQVFGEEGATEVSTAQTSEAQFTGEIDHLSQAIRRGGDVLTPGEMGLRDVRIIEALYRSAAERRWIELADDMTMRA